jgi:hypothetical protein
MPVVLKQVADSSKSVFAMNANQMSINLISLSHFQDSVSVCLLVDFENID